MRRLVLAAALLALGAPQADALTLLTAEKVAVVRTASDGQTVVRIRFGRDRALRTLERPACPAASTLQLAGYSQATSLLEAQPVVALPCERWRGDGRRGYRYTDRAGAASGVRRIVYARDRLTISFAGQTAPPLAGPVGYLEVWLTIGSQRYLGRFHNFRRNEPTLLVTRRPSKPAANGEAFFWDTLWGDADRASEAIHCLEQAVRKDPKDGRSHFLLGMMHLYRFGRAISDYRTSSDEAKSEIVAAEQALSAAAPLLWDGTRGDTRVPGFAAAAIYVKGIVLGDPDLVARGLTELDAAVAVNPLFNSFDLIGVVPQVVTPNDPLYVTRVLPVVDDLLYGGGANCVVTQPEICGNDGMAPRNIPGALLLFGDLYAKGGRPGDREKALTWYGLSNALGEGWEFRPLVADRLLGIDARVAAYQDADPGNDPPIVGLGAENCAICHTR